jgi:hypothetical protein
MGNAMPQSAVGSQQATDLLNWMAAQRLNYAPRLSQDWPLDDRQTGGMCGELEIVQRHYRRKK